MGHEAGLRVVKEEDAKEVLEIKRPYVEKTVISFEYETPSLEEFAGRIRRTLKKYPYLAAERDGEILGYAYTSPFVGRIAYQYSAETTIYLREDQKRNGLGRRLYQALEEISRLQNLTNLYACIGYPETEDEYLTKISAQFHAHMGYRMVGEFRQCGYKFGRWYHMVWMEKQIAEHGEKPEPVRWFPELAKEELAVLGL